MLDTLVAHKTKLPNLQALFVGDIVQEENEVSWITQGDMSALWGAFPKLTEFVARGADGLKLGKIRHERLQSLVLQSGGLSRSVVGQALAADAPLVHLELWLGAADNGANASAAHFANLFAGELFPHLKYLGLRNSEITDDLAEALAASPLLERLEVLDLSKGTLSDCGARALAASGKLSHLRMLDISHHYVSDEGLKALAEATPVLAADERQEAYDGDFYVAVSE